MISRIINQKRKNRTKGFTLLEVMITLGLLSFEILAVMAMFSASVKANSYAQNLTAASSLAQTGIEAAKNTAYADLADTTECFDRNLATANCSDPGVFQRQMTVSTDTPIAGMTEVEIVVSWVDMSGNDHSTHMVSSISMY
jgi:prepilin-type N-terminal cleavage/methylation domain-containing protein